MGVATTPYYQARTASWIREGGLPLLYHEGQSKSLQKAVDKHRVEIVGKTEFLLRE